MDDWASIHALEKTTVSILKKERYELDADCLKKIPLRDANIVQQYLHDNGQAAESMPSGLPDPPRATAMSVANNVRSVVAPVPTAPLADLC